MRKPPLSSWSTLAIIGISALTSCIPASTLHGAPRFEIPEEARLHILDSFLESAPPNGSAPDTVWAHREYASMYIHQPILSSYREAIERAFPEHVITFDVVFSADKKVPWHADFDSLGPFDASLRSIAREDFITVHANLVSPGGEGEGLLQTIDSLPLACLHWVSNQLTGTFGSLGAETEMIAAYLSPRTHTGGLGVGHAFNNLKAHSVTAGRGRISYVVRLVKRDVITSRAKVSAMAHGTLGSRRLHEFARLLPLMQQAQVPAGRFPWADVAGKHETA